MHVSARHWTCDKPSLRRHLTHFLNDFDTVLCVGYSVAALLHFALEPGGTLVDACRSEALEGSQEALDNVEEKAVE